MPCCADAPFFDELRAQPVSAHVGHVISTCVGMKRDLVAADEFDRGSRQLLNLGHTFGHAVEACSGYTVAARLRRGHRHGHHRAGRRADAASARTIPARRSSRSCGSTVCRRRRTFAAMRSRMPRCADKKIAGGALHLIVPERIGCCRIETGP